MELMPKDWFEMPEIRKRFYDKSVWVPLKQSAVLLKKGKYGYLGYREEYFGLGSVAFPLSKRTEAEKLGWDDIGTRNLTTGFFDGRKYTPSYIYKRGTLTGENLVLRRSGNYIEDYEWLLSQDIEVTLELKREGDCWYAISYGYEDVVKIERDKENLPISLLMRASYLKDYLRARRMALYITSYRSRRQTVEDAGHIDWKDPNIERSASDRWEGMVRKIHEGGNPFGTGFTVLHISRTDVDFDEEIPELGFPADDKVESETKTGQFQGRELFAIEGELWRNEWIEPASKSVIVCNESIKPSSFFITNNSGKKESRRTLNNGVSRWLWFKPSVVNYILGIRGSSLKWYTKNTGDISCSPGEGVHFGINEIGLINVFAKDIALLPDWQQQIWAGYNIAPDGKVSAELLMSQMKARPASTQAPEEFLLKGVDLLNKTLYQKHNIKVIKDHPDINVEDIMRKAHRFRALNQDGLFQLAKEIIKLTSERIDATLIKTIVQPKKEEKWGPLKSLERLLALDLGEENAYNILTPFWGIYDLRGADAHLSAEDLNEAYKNCQIDTTKPFVIQGYQLLNCAVSSLFTICSEINKHE